MAKKKSGKRLASAHIEPTLPCPSDKKRGDFVIFTSEEWQKLSLSREWCIRLDLRKPPRMLNPGNFTLETRLFRYIIPTKQQNIYVN